MNAEYLTEETIVIPKTSTKKIAQVMGRLIDDGTTVPKITELDEGTFVIDVISGRVYGNVKKHSSVSPNPWSVGIDPWHNTVADSYSVSISPDEQDRVNGTKIKNGIEEMQERSLRNKLRRLPEGIRFWLTQGHIVFP